MVDRPIGCFVGLCTVDLAYVVAELPSPNQKVSAAQQELTAGGPAANAAVTFSGLGGIASLITAIGKHPLAAIALGDLRHQGVDVCDVAARPELPPAVSSICILAGSGDRTVVSANSAALTTSPDALRTEILADANILLVDGHHMTLCIAAAKEARERGICVVLDGGSWKEGMDELLPLVDVAICSEDFGRFPEGVASIAVTHGGKPVHWSTGESGGEIPVKTIRPIDTSGAGDIFHGAFCLAYARGLEFRKALEFASKVATESCLSYGTRSWMKAGTVSQLLSTMN
jgi:sugar/nucleoside kinase (ribokinase family)